MRLAIRHRTEYAYADPVAGSVQYLRLTPRAEPIQSVIRWRLSTPGTTAPWRDGFGNQVHTLVVCQPTGLIVVEVDGEVDTVETHGVLPPDRGGPPPEVFLRPTPATTADAAVCDFAAGLEGRRNRGTLPALHALMAELHAAVAALPDSEDAAGGPAQALAAGAGVPRDHAHLFIACCRLWGIPARFVSGYLHTQAAEDGQIATHAWAEALVEDLGWVSFDPANCRSATQAYVRLAVAPDACAAAPVRGIRTGGGAEELRVRVRIRDTGR